MLLLIPVYKKQDLENKCNKIFLDYANKFDAADTTEVIKIFF